VHPGGPEPTADERRRDRFWDSSDSGARIVSRPIVVDGLESRFVQIELAPRIRWSAGQLVDDSFRAVDVMASQLVRAFTLEQLAMATVALQIHMRKARAFIQRKKELQDRWTSLARRMRKLRAEDRHLTWTEEQVAARRGELGNAVGEREVERLRLLEIEQLLEIEETEVAQRRKSWLEEEAAARADWSDLEEEDERLLKDAPSAEQTEDLRFPYILTLVAPQGGTTGRRRNLATAMNTLVDALQKPLSRTDQMLLEIALRRCVREHAPEASQPSPEGWERALLHSAEDEFVGEFPWAADHRASTVTTRSGSYSRIAG
jgi:hypothetical protein